MKTLLITCFSFLTALSWAQNPVQWSTQARKTGDNTFDLVIRADIEPKWHLYALEMPENGPLPTEFSFKGVNKVGALSHSEFKTDYDPIFETELDFFELKAVFYQSIQIDDPSMESVEVEVIYQACDDKLCIFRQEVLDIR